MMYVGSLKIVRYQVNIYRKEIMDTIIITFVSFLVSSQTTWGIESSTASLILTSA